MFFDFHIQENILLVREAERLGYAGMALFKGEDQKNRKNGNHYHTEDFDVIKNKSSIQILRGVEILAQNPGDMKRKVQKFRKNADVLMVYGGDLKINRAACEDSRVDIISHPYRNRRDCGINHILARKAAENSVAIELNLKYLSKNRSNIRYRVFAKFKEILKLHRKFKFPLIITSNAHSIYDLHTPRDIIALTRCFGMDKKEAVRALSVTPRNILERNNLRNSMVVEGVRIIE